MKDNQFEIPFQIQTLIESMQNKKETEHIRNNYRMRLDSIRNAINRAILEHDLEMGTKTQNDGRVRRESR